MGIPPDPSAPQDSPKSPSSDEGDGEYLMLGALNPLGDEPATPTPKAPKSRRPLTRSAVVPEGYPDMPGIASRPAPAPAPKPKPAE